MNDRYLYRAKRTDNGEWVEGSYVYTFTEDKDCSCAGIYKENHWIVEENGNMVSIDPSTICQCTGLRDKNGKLIWENDIVTGWFDGKRITGYIMYGSNATFFIERKGLYGIRLDNSEDWLDVIGNIFDNPELLEVGE